MCGFSSKTRNSPSQSLQITAAQGTGQNDRYVQVGYNIESLVGIY